MRVKYILYFSFLLTLLGAKAQTVNYNGLGRAYITDDYLNGNLVEGDSTSATSGTGGYFLFDLGINIHPSDALKAHAILRSRMEFGGFFGDGANLEFRQFNISGILGTKSKGVKYEMGDLDLQLSPFTLYNSKENLTEFESDIFAQRRDIVYYENFNFGNNWRLQGVNLETQLKFDQLLESADIQVFGTRTKNSRNFQEPDRFLVGSKLLIHANDQWHFGANLTHFFDALSTTQLPSNKVQNTVISGELSYSKKIGENKLGFHAESGVSQFEYFEALTETGIPLSDFLTHVKGSYGLSKLNIKAELSYRYVGFDFLSAGSQTRRVQDFGVPSAFGSVMEATEFRVPTLFDRYSQEAIYNQTLSPVLMRYNPRYNLVTPYGISTPNRQGFTVGIKSIDTKKWYEYDLEVQLLTEVVGEGVSNTRSFQALQAGTNLKLGDVFELSNDLNIVFGARRESSKRDDVLVDFTSTLLNAGLEYEAVKNLYAQIGLKAISTSGSEYIGIRNEFNVIDSYAVFNSQEENSEINEQILSLGIKYNFGKYSVFSFNAHFSDVTNESNGNLNYSINQYFFGYTLKF